MLDNKKKLIDLLEMTNNDKLQEVIMILLRYDKILNNIKMSLEQGVDSKKIIHYIEVKRLK
jgi:hypothetical protein